MHTHIVTAFLLTVVLSITAIAQTPHPPEGFREVGGSNYVMFGVDEAYRVHNEEGSWFQPGVLQPIVGTFHQQEPEVVLAQLKAMHDNGQRKIAMMLWIAPLEGDAHPTGVWGHVVDSSNGRLRPQHALNLRDFLRLLRASDYFDELIFRVALQGAAAPQHWEAWDEDRYQENWNFVISTREIVETALAGSRMTVTYDLGAENGGLEQAHAQEYERRFWKDYVARFGAADSCAFSVALHPGRVKQLIEDCDAAGVRPPVVALDVYGNAYDLLKTAAAEMNALGMERPQIILMETFYNDAKALAEIQRAGKDCNLDYRYLMQWPMKRDHDVPHFSEDFAVKYDAYLSKVGQPADPALAPPRVVINPGPEYGGDTRGFQGIPGIERAANGRLWALWYGGGPGEGPQNYTMVSTSGDDGATWTDLSLVIDPEGPVRAYDPCLWHDPTGKLWLFWAQSYEWWDGRSGVWCMTTENSGDERPDWTAPRRICDGILMNKPTVLKNGDWLMPVSIWTNTPEKEAAPFDQDNTENFGALAMRSQDQGATWTRIGQARLENPSFDEHMFVEKNNGDLWMLVRTRYGIGQAFSKDSGVTWPEHGPSGIEHTSARFFIRRLNSGNLLLVRHAPPGKPTRSHLTAFLSKDDGATWEGGLVLDERKGVSYPDGIQTEDGLIYIIYDYNRTTTRHILMTTFTEEDILAKGYQSPKARQRVLVNHAVGPE